MMHPVATKAAFVDHGANGLFVKCGECGAETSVEPIRELARPFLPLQLYYVVAECPECNKTVFIHIPRRIYQEDE